MKTIITLALICAFGLCKAQAPVDVAENTFKVKGLGEEVFYYGFAAGDQLLFTFSEVDGKELKEVEIIEMPGSSKFMDYKSKKVDTKTLHINSEAIYKFRFANGNVAGRICKIKIQRIPASPATANFNTNVLWRIVYDTTYTTEQERYLVKSDTSYVDVGHPELHIERTLVSNHPVSTNFLLPKNTVEWGYFINVDQSKPIDWSKLASDASGSPLAKYSGYGQTARLVFDVAAAAGTTQGDASLQYYLVNGANKELFDAGSEFNYIKAASCSSDIETMRAPLTGEMFFCFVNSSSVYNRDIEVKVTAIVVNNTWGERPISKMHIAERRQAYLAK